MLVVLYGPTGSGKTALSVQACLQLRASGREPVVLSADSRQVYRGLDIGTSKTTSEEMHGIRHELIDVADPDRKFELADYVALARPLIATTQQDGGIPVVVGGTAIYVRSLIEGWQVDRVAEVRRQLARDFPRGLTDDAYQTLLRLDPRTRVHRRNHDGVLNALARVMSGADDRPAPAQRPLVLGLDRPAADLDARVARTFDDQVRRGLLDEILSLDARYDLLDQLRRLGPDAPNQVLHTHGYAEWFEVALARGHDVSALTPADRQEVRELVVARIRSYTRRQRATFRELPGVRMVHSPEQLARRVLARLAK